LNLTSYIVTKKYINLNNYGLDVALREMKDVIEGRNVFSEGEVEPFQNIRAYASDVDKGLRIEFRAESYSESQSKFVILFTNGSKDDMDCEVRGISLPTQYVESSSVFNGKKENAFIVGTPSPTPPGFPFVVTLKFKSNKIDLITGIMAAISPTTAKSIPVRIQLPALALIFAK
jgi:hypothetical protein